MMDDVTVVGAGVIGLTCALRLLEAGARVTVRCADASENTVSSVAAAVWYPSGFPAADARSLNWAKAGFDHLVQDAIHNVPGVSMRRTRMLLREPMPTPWWAPAVPDFRLFPTPDSLTGAAHEWHFTAPSVHMRLYLDWLLQRVTRGGGRLERRPVDDIADLDTPVVVNATGLQARSLAHDDAVYPIRGRLVLVSNPGLDVSVRDEGNPAGSTYIHPRRNDVVLGGTVEPGMLDTSPDPAATAAILQRCRALVPELAQARLLQPVAGLRPGRTGGIRLEMVDGARPGQRVLHSYGHAGAGVTLAWGCADDALRIIQGDRLSP